MQNIYRDDFYDSLLGEIKISLTDQSLTQAQVGDCLGLKQSAVSSLLSGRSRMSLDQFFLLSELLGALPQTLIQRASSRVQEVQPMTAEQENALYKSEVHLVCYGAAIKPIRADAIKVVGVPGHLVKEAFEDLRRAGFLLEKSPGLYVQKNPRLTYKASTRLKGSVAHQRICMRSWQYFDHKYDDTAFRANKFNLYDLDLFTDSQIKELDAALMKVYERIQAIKQSNLATGYASAEPMGLWNIHLMMMTPVEIKYE